MTLPQLFAVAPPGLEDVVAQELKDFEFSQVSIVRGGVNFVGDPIRANRWLATPSRILQRISRFKCFTFAQLEAGVQAVDWNPYGAFTVQASCHGSRLYHSGAVEDRISALVPAGEVMLQARVVRNRCTLSIDTSGELLHRRGWRLKTGAAPVRENVAAAILRRAGWIPGMPIYDPMCGSGTFLIEAASQAAGLAPGRLRSFACENWATEPDVTPPGAVETHIAGSDRSEAAVAAAEENAQRAGVGVSVHLAEASSVVSPTTQPGLLVCNPPYGKRIRTRQTQTQIRALVTGPFAQWKVAILHPAGLDERHLGRSVIARHPMKNGGLAVELICL